MSDDNKEYNRMIQHYETMAKPVHRSGVWCCPSCGKRIQYNHSFCHYCGKRIGWVGINKQ